MNDTTMPPLGHPEPHTMKWTDLELAAIHDYARAYAAQCLAAVAEDAVRLDFIEMNARQEPRMCGNHAWWPTNFNHALVGPTLRAAIDNARGNKQ